MTTSRGFPRIGVQLLLWLRTAIIINGMNPPPFSLQSGILFFGLSLHAFVNEVYSFWEMLNIGMLVSKGLLDC